MCLWVCVCEFVCLCVYVSVCVSVSVYVCICVWSVLVSTKLSGRRRALKFCLSVAIPVYRV